MLNQDWQNLASKLLVWSPPTNQQNPHYLVLQLYYFNLFRRFILFDLCYLVLYQAFQKLLFGWNRMFVANFAKNHCFNFSLTFDLLINMGFLAFFLKPLRVSPALHTVLVSREEAEVLPCFLATFIPKPPNFNLVLVRVVF
jgi:hypothetical protein